MKILPPLATLVLAAGLWACQGSSLVWHKEGATTEDLQLAVRTCSRKSESYNFAMESGRNRDDLLGGERRAGSAGGAVYRDCMERQGWRRIRS
jgi:hypothetical protein